MPLMDNETGQSPKQKDELYKDSDSMSRKILMAWDHSMTTSIEMQLTWVQDDFTNDQTFEHIMGEVHCVDVEFKDKSLRCQYVQKYVWYDKYVMRPCIKDTELQPKDYAFESDNADRITKYSESERMWSMLYPNTIQGGEEIEDDMVGK